MATAHVFFGKPVTPDTSTALIHGCRLLLSERNEQGVPLWDTFSIAMASGGGDVVGGFAMFNELKGLPVSVHTHNAGAVDSSAILPFMAGARRTASEASAFFFHQLHWVFPSQGNLTMSSISDAATWLTRYEGLMASIVASRSNLSKDEVLRMMSEGTSVDTAQAKQFGLIHDIEEMTSPIGLRSWQV